MHLDQFFSFQDSETGVGVGVSPSGGAVGPPSRHAASMQSEETLETKTSRPEASAPTPAPAPQPAPRRPAARATPPRSRATAPAPPAPTAGRAIVGALQLAVEIPTLALADRSEPRPALRPGRLRPRAGEVRA